MILFMRHNVYFPMTDPLSCKMINRMQINTNTNTNTNGQSQDIKGVY